MTDPETIERLNQLFGGSIHYLNSKTTTGKAVYRWYVGRSGSIGLITRLKPFMSPRRQEQIEKMLDRDKLQERKWT